jgi:hypothetical protein
MLGKESPPGQLTNEQLLEKMERMEARIRSLEGELHRSKSDGTATNGSKTRVANTRKSGAKEAAAQDQPVVPDSTQPGKSPPAAAWNVAPAPGYMGARETAALEAPTPANEDLFGVAPSPLPGLKIGAYGEMRFGGQQNPDANGQWQTGFDAARLVLLPTYQFNDNIIFNSEIEFEHGALPLTPTTSCMGRPRSNKPMSISGFLLFSIFVRLASILCRSTGSISIMSRPISTASGARN